MKLLLDNTLAPVTSTLCFVEATPKISAEAFASDLETYYANVKYMPRKNLKFAYHFLAGDLQTVLTTLEPLTSREKKRYLFIPTHSQWTAYFDNGTAGIDIHDFRITAMQNLKARLLKVLARPPLDVYRGLVLEMELYSAGRQRSLVEAQRHIHLSNDDLQWQFYSLGEPFPFEDTQRYLAKSKKDRFTFEMLDEYLKQLGVSAFDADFYMPEGSEALLLEKHGNLDITHELSIADAQKLNLS